MRTKNIKCRYCTKHIWSTLLQESILCKVRNTLREFPFHLHKNEAACRSYASLLKVLRCWRRNAILTSSQIKQSTSVDTAAGVVSQHLLIVSNLQHYLLQLDNDSINTDIFFADSTVHISLKSSDCKNSVSIYHKLFSNDGEILIETFMKFRDVRNSRNIIPLNGTN